MNDDSTWSLTTGRLRALATGKIRWVSEDGETEDETLPWKVRWQLFGVHSYNWSWVRRFGQLRCGCSHNPLTRRMVLTAMDCPQHGLDWAELKGCADYDELCCASLRADRFRDKAVIGGEIEDVYLDDDEIVISGACRLSASEATALAAVLVKAAIAVRADG